MGTKKLNSWAITPSLKDDCFQAYPIIVITSSFPLPLRKNFKTLISNLGCFPLDIGS